MAAHAPGGVSTPQVRLAALLEPAPQISSDLFDWSLNGSRLAITLLEASGRGVPAAQGGDLALAALRNARRLGRPLAEQAALADQAMWSRYTGHAVVHALGLLDRTRYRSGAVDVQPGDDRRHRPRAALAPAVTGAPAALRVGQPPSPAAVGRLLTPLRVRSCGARPGGFWGADPVSALARRFRDLEWTPREHARSLHDCADG